MMSQYGIRIATKEFLSVSWSEFSSMLTGIGPDTVLGRVVAIRSEQDENIIKHFTSGQRKIYDDWRTRKGIIMSDDEFEKGMADLERLFANICK